MLSHLDDDGPVRLDGVKLGVCEAMGLEIDEPKLGAFAGALNALDFPVQLLIRQHPPRLGQLREKLQEAQPGNLPPQTEAASESLRRLLMELETRDGILDRRFYAVCEFSRIDDLRGLLARAGLSVHPLRGRQLRMFPGLRRPRRLARRRGRGDTRVGGDGQTRPPRRRPPRPLPAPWQVAPVAGSRIPPGADGGGSADGPVHPCRPHPRRTGGADPGVGRRCGSSRRSPCPSSGAAPCRRRRRSPWRT